MSAALVDSVRPPHPHQMRDIRETDVLQPPSDLVVSALQLAPFASQHHLSEYNRIKFGAQGSPLEYSPLSVHMPMHFDALLQRKRSGEKIQKWWPCSKQYFDPPVLGPCAAPVTALVDLTDEISDAMASPLEQSSPSPALPPPLENMPHRLKTSSTHPINISAIIPPELIPIISVHLSYSLGQPPIIFDIPPNFTLDRLIRNLPPPSKYSLPFPLTCHHRFSGIQGDSPHPEEANLSQTRSSVSKAVQAALNCRIPSINRVVDKDPLPLLGLPDIHTALSRSRSASSEIPKLAKSGIAGRPKLQHTKSDTCVTSVPPPPTIASSISSSHAATDCQHSSMVFVPTGIDPIRPPPNAIIVTRRSSPEIPPGNLYLSSCPGKKVRLNGPVKGRSSVCRDVEADLLRIRQLGIRCVICCLDNDELEFLGIPWPEYCQAAQRMELDILRLPTPEGLAPLTPAELDAHLSELINSYTLKGIPMLVHCRGGVGRAGVFACAWMIKLGLCGWIETDFGDESDTIVRRDTLQLVARVINVARRRRSVKAVETYEQVKFLVDYVEMLRAKGQRY